MFTNTFNMCLNYNLNFHLRKCHIRANLTDSKDSERKNYIFSDINLEKSIFQKGGSFSKIRDTSKNMQILKKLRF